MNSYNMCNSSEKPTLLGSVFVFWTADWLGERKSANKMKITLKGQCPVTWGDSIQATDCRKTESSDALSGTKQSSTTMIGWFNSFELYKASSLFDTDI